ncbi:hypothetical protein BC628DRAFT_838977 [Trametes gibbosa]|nr:hypothetical protein BC628DRAFT_838977 [Trametes gibbosa]
MLLGKTWLKAWRSNSVRSASKELRPTKLVLDTRSPSHPSPPRSSHPSPRSATFPLARGFESYSPTTPRSTVSAPVAWPQHATSMPASPESFVLTQPSAVSPPVYDFSRHYRDDSASDSSSNASIGSLSREASMRGNSPLSLPSSSQNANPQADDIGWQEPNASAQMTMYTIPIPTLNPNLYMAPGTIYHHPHVLPHAPPELIRNWRPALTDTDSPILAGSGECAERVYASANTTVNCHSLVPPASYFAGQVYH